MASKSVIRFGDDYNKHFDSKVYCTDFFGKIEIEGFSFTEFRLKTLHKIFSSGKVKGKCLLEIGSGPCIHTVIPASKWFEEIILTDYSSINRETQEKWLRQDADANDWGLYFKYFSKLDGNEVNWQQLESSLRPKIKRVLFCDVHKSNPLDPVRIEPVDTICSSACLESASPDKESYKKAMKNVSSLLAPGGMLILIGVLNCPFYCVGTEKFNCLPVTKDEVKSAVQDSGLTILEEFYDETACDTEETIFNGSIILWAQKKPT